jgi:hypothetical protein
MPLDAKQADWLNRTTGVQVPLPGGPPSGSGGAMDPRAREAENRKKLEEMLRARLEAEEFAEAQNKSLLINDAIRSIAPMKPVLRDALDLEQTTKDGKTRSYQTDDGDLSKSGDMRDIRNDTEIGKRGQTEQKKKKAKDGGGTVKDPLKNTDILKQAQSAMDFLVAVKNNLQAQKTRRSDIDWGKIDLTATKLRDDPFVPGPEQRLFTDTELMDEIYTPLVREHVLPENFVINKFSKVQRMLDATNKMYKEELKDANDPSSGINEVLQSCIDMSSQLVEAVLQAAGSDTKVAQDFLSGAAALAKLSVSTGFKLADHGLDASVMTDVLNGLGGVVSSVIAGSMPGESANQQQLAQVYGKIAQGAAAGVAAVVQTAASGKPDPDTLVNFFSAMLQAGLSDIPQNTEQDQDIVSLASDVTAAAATAVGGKANDFYNAYKTGDAKKLRSIALDMSTDFAIQSIGVINDVVQITQAQGGQNFNSLTVTQTSNQIITEGIEKKRDPGYNVMSAGGGTNFDVMSNTTSAAIGNIDNTLVTAGGQIKEGVGKVNEANKGEAPEGKDKKQRRAERRKMTAEEIEKLKKQLEPVAERSFSELEKEVAKKAAKREDEKVDFEQVGKEIVAEIEKERQEFQKQLKGLDNPAIDRKTINKLIAQMERDRTILQVAITIGQAGFEVASNFLGPMAIGTEAVKMAANIAAAVQRAVDLRKFLDEAAGAKAGTSPYLTSIQNFADNQKDQLAHHSIAAALNGAKIVAAAAATAFPAAAPAVTIVGAVQSGAEALYQFNTQQAVVAAWEVTKAALDDPENRRMGLKARRMNATLAKYAVAYGAIEERDPVAVHMANVCGLDAETLANKDTNAKKVKEFLEKKFNEDSKVTGRIKKDDDWSKKLPEPALKSVVLFRAYEVIAEGYADKKLQKLPPVELTTLVRALEKTPLPSKPTTEAMKDRLSLFGQIRGALGSERARLGEIDGAIGDVIEEYSDLIADEQQKLSMQLLKAKLEEAKAQKTQQGGTQPQQGGPQQRGPQQQQTPQRPRTPPPR